MLYDMDMSYEYLESQPEIDEPYVTDGHSLYEVISIAPNNGLAKDQIGRRYSVILKDCLTGKSGEIDDLTMQALTPVSQEDKNN